MPLKAMLLAAAPAGLLAGILLTALQLIEIVALLRAAEAFEPAGHGHAPSLLATAAANVTLATAFALLILAASSLRGGLDWRRGLLWGVAGYAVFFAAPALGLPPELPGSESAPLHARQIWWLGTVACTAGGLGLGAFGVRSWIRAAGVALLLMPHAIGAPASTGQSGVPADLARQFFVSTAIVNAAFWLALGALAGIFSAPRATPASAAA